MAYITRDELKGYIRTTEAGDDTLLDSAIDAAQEYIEGACGREFEGSTGSRYYRASDLMRLNGPGGAGTVLWLAGDLLALGGLTNGDGTTIASSDCWTEPRNRAPYQYIRLKTNESWVFDTDGEITVSGTWGYSTSAPADIKDATKQLAAYYYRLRANQITGVVANAETGSMTVLPGVPASVRKILVDGGYIKRRGIM